MLKKLVILTGAGISAESGIKTFRDADGLWEGHDVMEVASPQGFASNPELVLDFYNQRRRQLLDVKPNNAHIALADLETLFDIMIVTQNVDDLHERAGSTDVLHLHGELLKVRSTSNPSLVYNRTKDINLGDKCEKGSQLRPHIVWFGEQVPLLNRAAELTHDGDIIIIIGTSMNVYPAAGLVAYARPGVPVYYIDPNPNISFELTKRPNLNVIKEKGGLGVPKLVDKLLLEIDA
jgi:NAD-dependent deacetylase